MSLVKKNYKKTLLTPLNFSLKLLIDGFSVLEAKAKKKTIYNKLIFSKFKINPQITFKSISTKIKVSLMKIKKKIIKLNNIKIKLNHQFKLYMRKYLWSFDLLRIYLFVKISQNKGFIFKNFKICNLYFDYLKVYSFNYVNILNNIINNKFALNNQRNEKMKLEGFSKNKEEFKKINLKYKFN